MAMERFSHATPARADPADQRSRTRGSHGCGRRAGGGRRKSAPCHGAGGDGQRQVPNPYVGFSVEWPGLAAYETNGSAFARLIGLLGVAHEPVSLRLGGETADSTYWPTTTSQLPSKAYVANSDYFATLGQLARATPLSLMVDLNLAARSPGDGTVVRLTAASPSATTDLQFAGRTLDSAGQWIGAGRVERVRGPSGVFTVSVPRYSAALLTATP